MTAAIADRLPASFNISLGNESLRADRGRADAEMGIRELEALRLDADLVIPADAAELAEPLVKAFAGELTSGDHLRLQQKTFLDGPSMRAAVQRVLDVEIRTAPGLDPDAIRAEARMHRVLGALSSAVEHINNRASVARKY